MSAASFLCLSGPDNLEDAFIAEIKFIYFLFYFSFLIKISLFISIDDQSLTVRVFLIARKTHFCVVLTVGSGKE